MLTSGCSPSKMSHGWIYLTWRPIWWWNVDERFRTKRRILGTKEKGIINYRRSAKLSCSNFENVTAGKQRTPKTVKLVDLVKRFPRNTWWLNFNAFGFDTYGPRRRRERGFQIFENKETDAHLTRRSSSGDEDSSSQHRCPKWYLRGPVHAHSKQWI